MGLALIEVGIKGISGTQISSSDRVEEVQNIRLRVAVVRRGPTKRMRAIYRLFEQIERACGRVVCDRNVDAELDRDTALTWSYCEGKKGVYGRGRGGGSRASWSGMHTGPRCQLRRIPPVPRWSGGGGGGGVYWWRIAVLFTATSCAAAPAAEHKTGLKFELNLKLVVFVKGGMGGGGGYSVCVRDPLCVFRL